MLQLSSPGACIISAFGRFCATYRSVGCGLGFLSNSSTVKSREVPSGLDEELSLLRLRDLAWRCPALEGEIMFA